MLNNSSRGASGAAQAAHLAYGHLQFLEANTGLTNDARLQHYVFNHQKVLSNNRHFIAASQMEAQPNGDATTEGQSLQILGFAYMYEATGDVRYLQWAEQCFEAYVWHYYQEDVPATPRRWVCNWIINGKEPVLANWPINWRNPTNSGFKGVDVTISNGYGQIAHGAPYYGQYLDKATFAYRGGLGWDSIVATVYALNPDGSINWDKPGEQRDVDWIINWEGKKINWDGKVESRDQWGDDPIIYPEADKGKFKLKDAVSGVYKFCFANRQPVELGGYLMPRNSAWHNRPLHVPVGKENFGNAADAEEWFMDACYKLWELTGKQRYYNAWKACEFTCNEYVKIDQEDKYFRKSKTNGDPFSDGISYWYSYPSSVVPQFSRDAAGYINMRANAESQQTLEQNSIWTKAYEDTVMTSTVGVVPDVANARTSVTVIASVGPEKADRNLSEWQLTLPSVSQQPSQLSIALGSFTKDKDPYTGTPYIVADDRLCVEWSGTTWNMAFEDHVFDSRSATICKAVIPTGGGFMIGAWLHPNSRFVPNNLVYKASEPVLMEITAPNTNNPSLPALTWYCELPKTTAWRYHTFSTADFKLSQYQANYPGIEPGDGTPTSLGWPTALSYMPEQPSLVFKAKSVRANFDWYCVNTVPVRFTGTGYTIKYSLTIKCASAFSAKIGDCYAANLKSPLLYCTPGVIPFSNIYIPDQETFDGWHGMPYPGYQYPFIYVHNSDPDAPKWLDNMVEFLYQSQVWYRQQFGVSGPGASAYIWNRWDNLKYGKPDTWTMYHWGDGHAWDGYQPRAYFGAARCWWELEKWGKPVPQKLKDYVNNWSRFLIEYMQGCRCVPTYFPADKAPPYVTDDFTGHMSGLYLAGACMAASCNGGALPNLDWFIHECFREINDNYQIVDGKPNHIMNGSWTPALRLGTGDGPESNGMFFGFWSGELLRGLGIYILYTQGRL